MVKDSEITTAVNSAQNDIFNKYLEIYKKTGIQPSIIRPFIKSSTVSLTSGAGSLPSDYVHAITFFNTSDANEGTILDSDEWIDAKNSVMSPPSAAESSALIEGAGINVVPTSLASINLKYYRAPIAIVYNTTTDGDGRGTTFTSSGSTDTEFREDGINPLVKQALLYLGVSIDDQDAISIGVNEENKAA